LIRSRMTRSTMTDGSSGPWGRQARRLMIEATYPL
jgi:hypothetical protein